MGFLGRIYLHSLAVVVVVNLPRREYSSFIASNAGLKELPMSLPRFQRIPPSISHRTWKMIWTAFESCSRRTSAKEKEVRTVRLDRAAAAQKKNAERKTQAVRSFPQKHIIATKRRGNFFF